MSNPSGAEHTRFVVERIDDVRPIRSFLFHVPEDGNKGLVRLEEPCNHVHSVKGMECVQIVQEGEYGYLGEVLKPYHIHMDSHREAEVTRLKHYGGT